MTRKKRLRACFDLPKPSSAPSLVCVLFGRVDPKVGTIGGQSDLTTKEYSSKFPCGSASGRRVCRGTRRKHASLCCETFACQGNPNTLFTLLTVMNEMPRALLLETTACYKYQERTLVSGTSEKVKASRWLEWKKELSPSSLSPSPWQTRKQLSHWSASSSHRP